MAGTPVWQEKLAVLLVGRIDVSSMARVHQSLGLNEGLSDIEVQLDLF